MKDKKTIIAVIFLVILAVGIFLIINNDDNKNDDKKNKPSVNDKGNKKDNVVDLNEIELGKEYQLICTYDTTNGEYATDTYQTIDTFYSNGTCKYEFSHTNVYNNVDDYNEEKNTIQNNDLFNKCTGDIVFNDTTMTIKTTGGMGHCHTDGGESLCDGVKLNSTDELKEKIRPILGRNESRDDITCTLYKK